MEGMAVNWLHFGGVLALSSLVAFWNWASNELKWEGHTFPQVVVGVAGTVLIAGNVIGWDAVLVLAMLFAGAAVPVGVVYFWRAVKDTLAGLKAGAEPLKGLLMEEGGEDGNASANREA